MGWILIFAICILLVTVIKFSPTEEEKWHWGKLIGLYLTSIMSFNVGNVKLPLGILISLYFINRKPVPNRRLKNLALFFGFVYFLLFTTLPSIHIRDILGYREIFGQLNRFESVQSISVLSPDSPEQKELMKLVPNANGFMNLDDCIVMFRSWILKQENVSTEDFEWLWTQSYDQLKYIDTYHKVDDETAEGYMTFEDGREYFALFKKQGKTERYYLALVIQHKGEKAGSRVRSIPFVPAQEFVGETVGMPQIEEVQVLENNLNSAKIEFELAKGYFNEVKPSARVLNAKEPVYQGEGQAIDETLGKYRVELMFTDVRLDQKLVKELGLKKNSLGKNGENLLETIKVAYPPDDTLMVIYLGTGLEPKVSVDERGNKMTVKLTKK